MGSVLKEVCNCEGDLIKEKVEKELQLFSVLKKNISLIYLHISNGHFSDPFTPIKEVLHAYENALDDKYQDGVDHGLSQLGSFLRKS